VTHMGRDPRPRVTPPLSHPCTDTFLKGGNHKRKKRGAEVGAGKSAADR